METVNANACTDDRVHLVPLIGAMDGAPDEMLYVHYYVNFLRPVSQVIQTVDADGWSLQPLLSL